MRASALSTLVFNTLTLSACLLTAATSFANQQAIVYKPITQISDIEHIASPEVKPVAYTSVISLADLDVKTKKQQFFNMLLPSVLISKQRLAEKSAKVTTLLDKPELTQTEQNWLEQQLQKYRAKTPDELIFKLKPHANSIVLAQAAIESGWGTSRFFLKANNAFGVWSYNQNEPRLQAGETRGSKKIFVKKYESLTGSIDDYFTTLARGPYQQFRELRATGSDPITLVGSLNKYSEIGDEYVKRLRSVIRYNKLERFDSYQLAGLTE